jgi:predicted outer membrane protein
VDKNPTARTATALLVLLVPLSILIFGLVAPAAAGSPGSLSDNQVLITMYQHELWEAQAGQLAKDQAASQAVKDAGARITSDYQQLGKDTRELAGKLGVSLPTEPSAEQRSWLSDLVPKWGPEFDESYVRLLRDGDRKVLSEIKNGANTGNSAVQAFTKKASDLLTKHLTLLDGTGVVDAAAAPGQPASNASVAAPANAAHAQHGAVATAAQTSDTGGGVDVALVIAICLVEFAVTLGLVRLLRSR